MVDPVAGLPTRHTEQTKLPLNNMLESNTEQKGFLKPLKD